MFVIKKSIYLLGHLRPKTSTRMHSSRMRITRALTVSRGGVYLVTWGVLSPRRGYLVPGGCLPRGGLQEGILGPGGVLSHRVGVCPGGYLPRYPPPLRTEFLTHAYENITLPQTSFAGGNKNAFQYNVYCLLQWLSLLHASPPLRTPEPCMPTLTMHTPRHAHPTPHIPPPRMPTTSFAGSKNDIVDHYKPHKVIIIR